MFITVCDCDVTDLCWLAGWFLHYFPFYLMDRVLYFHHYIPAVMFNCIFSGVIIDYIVGCICRVFFPTPSALYNVLRGIFTIAVISVIVWSFTVFCHVSYGMVGPRLEYSDMKWMASWEI
eukprot:m.108078 g.108078  ORF g.108078 m.108078 type:complete len:120 (+) comp12699_c0_seq11:2141-2500(+)